MDFTPSLEAKGFYRFTGPPENWLTAIKFMTWGIQENLRDRWQAIQPGDVFFIHSTGAQTSYFKNAKSGIIGIGVVGSNFTIKDNFLWMKEWEEHSNRWPLLVPLSEVYLFSDLPPKETWDAPSLTNQSHTKQLINSLLKDYLPLLQIHGFPQMGSFSSVSREVAQQILYDRRPLYVHQTASDEIVTTTKRTKLEPVKSAAETLRYTETLKVFDTIKNRVVRDAPGYYERDNELLARAETAHSTILQNLIDLFKSRGYDTLSNRFVDLFAHNSDRAFLFEVKSTENRNFRSQARKGLIQLFEYDYFEIRKFINEHELDFKDRYKVLVPSQAPGDDKYVEFINALKVGVATVDKGSIKPAGTDLGFSRV